MISKIGSSKKGFTLVEMLIVVAIIAILTGIITTNFASSRSRARDAQRVSDISQLQLALAIYFDRCSEYPTTLSVTTECPNIPGVTLNISKIPLPPVGVGQTDYDYAINSSKTDYFLHAKLENPSSAIKNGMPSTPSWYTSGLITCSDASDATDYCVGPK